MSFSIMPTLVKQGHITKLSLVNIFIAVLSGIGIAKIILAI